MKANEFILFLMTWYWIVMNALRDLSTHCILEFLRISAIGQCWFTFAWRCVDYFILNKIKSCYFRKKNIQKPIFIQRGGKIIQNHFKQNYNHWMSHKQKQERTKNKQKRCLTTNGSNFLLLMFLTQMLSKVFFEENEKRTFHSHYLKFCIRIMNWTTFYSGYLREWYRNSPLKVTLYVCFNDCIDFNIHFIWHFCTENLAITSDWLAGEVFMSVWNVLLFVDQTALSGKNQTIMFFFFWKKKKRKEIHTYSEAALKRVIIKSLIYVQKGAQYHTYQKPIFFKAKHFPMHNLHCTSTRRLNDQKLDFHSTTKI